MDDELITFEYHADHVNFVISLPGSNEKVRLTVEPKMTLGDVLSMIKTESDSITEIKVCDKDDIRIANSTLFARLNGKFSMSIDDHRYGMNLTGIPMVEGKSSVVSDVAVKKPRLSFPHRPQKTSFESILGTPYFVDKTLMIKKITQLWEFDVTNDSSFQIIQEPIAISAPRRFGKTTNLEMLVDFFQGTLSMDVFHDLKIGKDESFDLSKWYGRFATIYITFGFAPDEIRSREDCIDACRGILHASFRKYQFIRNSLSELDMTAFDNWVDEGKFLHKTELEVQTGLRFLIECFCLYDQRPVLLCLDEFDKICCASIYKSGPNLRDIIAFYCEMVARVVKHNPVCSASILTGVTAITCRGISSLNNPIFLKFLANNYLYEFYGVTDKEFTYLMNKVEKPENERQELVTLANQWYNGYKYKDIRFFNTLSVKMMIKLGKVDFYWRRSGLAEGLAIAVRENSLREKIQYMINESEVVTMQLQELRPENFSCIQDESYKPADDDFILNFLLQQGYLMINNDIDYTIKDVSVEVAIPNREVRKDFTDMLMRYYIKCYNFDPAKIRVCASCFTNIDLSDDLLCKENLRRFKDVSNELLCNTIKSDINEAWIEGFLFSIFYQNAEILPQKRVMGTVRNNDKRTGRKLDLLVKMKNHCFIIEESLIESDETALRKLITKEYYKEVEELKLPYMLIGLAVEKNIEGIATVSMAYLLNTHVGDGKIV